MSRSTYARLFAAIGEVWGVGNGSTTFNVPDFRGAYRRGAGSHGSETMADGNPFAGPSVGAFEDDQMQQITGTTNFGRTADGSPIFVNSVGAFSDNGIGGNRRAISSGSEITARQLKFDSYDSTAQGGARTGDETRSFAAGVLVCIKV